MYKWYLLLGVCAYIGLHSRRAFSVKASIMPIAPNFTPRFWRFLEKERNFDKLSVPRTAFERERAILFFNLTRRRKRPREAKRRKTLALNAR